MRDWRSHVCSSDLRPHEQLAPPPVTHSKRSSRPRRLRQPTRSPLRLPAERLCPRVRSDAQKDAQPPKPRAERAPPLYRTDRTSVVSGTRLSVRVKLGVLLIIKINKKKTIQ